MNTLLLIIIWIISIAFGLALLAFFTFLFSRIQMLAWLETIKQTVQSPKEK